MSLILEVFAIASFLLVKLLLYVGWCYLACARLGFPVNRKGGVAIMLGLTRIGIGILIGSHLILLSMQEAQAVFDNQLLTYLVVFPPIRFLEWALILVILHVMYLRKRISVYVNFAYKIVWVLGGVIVSCLADIPILILSEGLPIGRLFC